MFGVEKLVLSKLYEEGSNKRIFNIDRHVGMVSRSFSRHSHTTLRDRARAQGVQLSSSHQMVRVPMSNTAQETNERVTLFSDGTLFTAHSSPPRKMDLSSTFTLLR